MPKNTLAQVLTDSAAVVPSNFCKHHPNFITTVCMIP